MEARWYAVRFESWIYCIYMTLDIMTFGLFKPAHEALHTHTQRHSLIRPFLGWNKSDI